MVGYNATFIFGLRSIKFDLWPFVLKGLDTSAQKWHISPWN